VDPALLAEHGHLAAQSAHLPRLWPDPRGVARTVVPVSQSGGPVGVPGTAPGSV
jgi:hypothetical protein